MKWSLPLDDVLFARSQMAMSLAFHIVFASVGVAMPLLMVIAEILWRRTGHPDYLALVKSWSKGTAVLFAVGAVSGTVLSFELGLLFPTFMKHAGAVIGMPFSLEGFAFFTEAIFLGIYLYGWERISPRLHILAGVIVAVSGFLSALFVTIANAWMNAPVGFRVEHGRFVDIDPVAALFTPMAPHEIIHSGLAAYMATAFAVAGIHAWALLRGRVNRSFHAKALGVALAVAIPTALLQPFVGHLSGQRVAKYQPLKLAAMEQLVKTQAHAPLQAGPLEIPGGLSFMAFNDFDAVVKGLEEFPRADWPSPIVRVAFQVMTGFGTALAGLCALALLMRIRGRKWDESPGFLKLVVLCGPLGLLALEAGWVVTEVGRQPWIIYNFLRTRDAVTPMTGLVVPFTTFTLVYLGLALTVIAILRQQIRESAETP